ncbi:Endonuclease MutS2 [Phycisphaerae bacterium RAS1]|nr:Endonuclease MutS2 [Phycisphaerae bacterium RAS1]
MDAHALQCLDFARIRELLAGFALTGLGRGLAHSIKPVQKADLVRRWLGQVDELSRLDDLQGMPPFGGISDIREIIPRCTPPLRVSVDDMASVGRTLEGTHALSAYFATLPAEGFAELHHLAQRIGDFRTIADRIAAVIDERGQVRDDASPKIRRIRHEIADASAQIAGAVDKLLADPGVRRFLQYPNATFHNDRTVLPLRTEYRGRLPGIIHRTSDSGATLYVEPGVVVELNNRITNLRSEEQEEINRLLWELAHEVKLNEREILSTLDTLAVVDLIAAKLRFSRSFGLRCPDVADEYRVNVRQARHPLLLELFRQRREAGETPGEVVPIDYRIGEDFHMLIITGPNTGGKTVTLKTIGLLSVMVQAGLPVPVGPGSTFGMFGNVLIDVGDEQSLQQSLSTFSAHLRRLLEMLARSNAATLVLIDEIGAGTDPDEGAAIGRAILDELLRVECRCLVTTHLGALKAFALTREKAENACVEFDIETLRPTYHLRIGESGMSNAIDIAQRLGMPRRLVIAARRNLSKRARAMRDVLEGTSVVKRNAETARQEAQNAKLAAEQAAQESASAKVQFERKRADFETWVQHVVHLQPGDAVRVRGFDRDGKIVRMRLDQQRAEVDVGAFTVEVPLGDVLPPQAPPPPPRALRPPPPPPQRNRPRGPQGPAPRGPQPPGGPRPPRDEHRERPRPPQPPMSDEEAAALKPGDVVFSKRFHRDGRVVRVKKEKKIAVLSVGLLEVEIPFSGLAKIETPPGKAAARKNGPDLAPRPAPHAPLSDVPSA